MTSITGKITKYGDKTAQALPENVIETMHGYAIYKDRSTALEYLNDIKEYSLDDKDFADQLQVAYKLYKNETIVATAVDVLVEFATTNVIVESENEEYKKIFDHWLTYINRANDNMDTGSIPFMEQFFISWFVFGNSVPKWVYDAEEVDGVKYKLPMILNYYDPRLISINDTEMMFSRKNVYYKVPDEIQAIAKKKPADLTDEEKDLFKSLDKDLVKELQEGKSTILLDRRFFKHFKRKSPPYEKYGIPYVLKALPAVADFKRLQALDSNTIDGFLNQVTIFKLGDLEHPETISKRRMSQFAALLNNPTPSLYMVWTPDVSVETTAPPGDLLKISDRYRQAVENILDALGVPVHFISGRFDIPGDTLFGSSLALMEKLKKPREVFLAFLIELKDQIYEHNKLDPTVKTVFNLTGLNMRDPQSVQTMINSGYERGTLSVETLHQNLDQKTEIEKIRRIREKEEGFDEIFFPPVSQHTTPGVRPENVPQGEEEEEPKKEEAPEDVKEEEVEKAAAATPLHTKVLLTYAGITRDLVDKKRKNREINKELISKIVGSSLKKIETQVSKDFYNLVTLNEATKDVVLSEDFTFSKLGAWSMRFLAGIKEELVKTLASALHSRLPNETFSIISNAILVKYKDKITKYIEACFCNSNLAYEVVLAKTDGYTRVTIQASSECSYCNGSDRDEVPIDSLFDLRVHFGCNCDVKFLKDEDKHV